MQALKRVWSEELRGHLHHLAVRDAAEQPETRVEPDGEATSENVVRAFPRREPPVVDRIQARPELSAALAAVTQAANHIKAADERADAAERHADEIAQRACAQLEGAEAEIASTQAQIRMVQDQAAQAAIRWSQEIKAAEARAEAAESRAADLETEVEDLAERLATAEAVLIQAKDHIFAAETRALEAREDMRCLAAQIREQFGIPGR